MGYRASTSLSVVIGLASLGDPGNPSLQQALVEAAGMMGPQNPYGKGRRLVTLLQSSAAQAAPHWAHVFEMAAEYASGAGSLTRLESASQCLEAKNYDSGSRQYRNLLEAFREQNPPELAQLVQAAEQRVRAAEAELERARAVLNALKGATRVSSTR